MIITKKSKNVEHFDSKNLQKVVFDALLSFVFDV